MRESVLRIIGATIRTKREAAGLSQEELATRAGLHRTYVGGIERGERNLGVKNLVSIAHALNVPPHSLLSDIERAAVSRKKNA